MEATSALPTKPVDFEFSGKGWEYFKIWIVNILLTILTLGIYSAWAKVRTKQYFYGNTKLAGTSFEYTADPIVILSGRLIVFGIFLIYTAANHTFPAAGAVMALLIVLAMPWIIVRAKMFNARYSNYRNISFSFNNDLKGAVITFILFGLVMVLTAGLAFPYYYYRVHKFMVANHNYGNLSFDMNSVWKKFYMIYIKTILIIVGMVIAIVFFSKFLGLSALSGLAQLAMQGAGQQISGIGFSTMILGVLMLSMLMSFFVYSYVRTNILNTVWSNVKIGVNNFESNLQLKGMLWVYVTNTFGILLSLGLLTPWAKVRMARYRISHLQVWAEDNINEVIAKQQKTVGAAGGEMSDFLDVDLAM